MRDEDRRAGQRRSCVSIGRDDGIETGEQAARRQQIGQQINAAARRRFWGCLGSCVTAGIIGESLT